jgi:hypothetical protein
MTDPSLLSDDLRWREVDDGRERNRDIVKKKRGRSSFLLTYPDWNSSTNTPTGPTQVTREDRPGSYTEAFTMIATPHLTKGVADGSGAAPRGQTLPARPSVDDP